MHNPTIIARLQALGPLPDDSTLSSATFQFLLFAEIVQQFTAPLSLKHAITLNKSRTATRHQYPGYRMGTESCRRSTCPEALQQAAALAADTEVKRTVKRRLANYLKAKLASPIHLHCQQLP